MMLLFYLNLLTCTREMFSRRNMESRLSDNQEKKTFLLNKHLSRKSRSQLSFFDEELRQSMYFVTKQEAELRSQYRRYNIALIRARGTTIRPLAVEDSAKIRNVKSAPRYTSQPSAEVKGVHLSNVKSSTQSSASRRSSLKGRVDNFLGLPCDMTQHQKQSIHDPAAQHRWEKIRDNLKHLTEICRSEDERDSNKQRYCTYEELGSCRYIRYSRRQLQGHLSVEYLTKCRCNLCSLKTIKATEEKKHWCLSVHIIRNSIVEVGQTWIPLWNIYSYCTIG